MTYIKHDGELQTPNRIKVCIVSSCGGHLTEVRTLRPAYTRFEHFYVLNDRVLLPEDMTTKTHFVSHSERDLRVLVNLYEAWRILRKERPSVILSTGAGIAVPFAIMGRLLGVPTVFVETFTRVIKPSLTGRIMYYLAARLFYQWGTLRRAFPKGVYGGPLT